MPSVVNPSILTTIGIILSAMVYGSIISITLTYFPLLMKTSQTMSRFLRNFLLIYVTIMTMLGTVFMISTILPIPIYFKFQVPTDHINLAFDPPILAPFDLSGDICFVLASWGADGFMLWRCAILYYGVSKYSRWAIITVLLIFGLATFAMGIIGLIFGSTLAFSFICITTFLNIITAALIASRILYCQRYIRQAIESPPDNPYTNIIIICVESSALIVICNVIYLVLDIISSPYVLIILELMVNIYVISPLLIVYRVAMGKAVVIPERLSGARPVSILQFRPQSTLPVSNGA